MFRYLFTFELRYWLRQPMVYVFMLVNVLMFAWASASDDVSIGGSFGNIYKNAPYVVQNQFGVWCLFALLMTTAFIQNAAIRDFNYKTNQIVFSSPIKKLDYLAGRFLGSFIVSLIPFLGISLGIMLGTLIGQATGSVDAERYGPTELMSHVNSFLVFAIPNTFISGAIIFALAALTRSTIISFVGAILLLVAYGISSSFLSDVENERLAFFVDAFGARPFELITKYWTVSEKNTLSVGLSNPDMLMNRLIWTGVGVGILVFTYFRFSFAERNAVNRKKKKDHIQEDSPRPLFIPLQPLPVIRPQKGASVAWTQMLRIARSEFWGIITGTAFIVILLAGMLNMGFSLQYSDRFYGLMSYPVTYQVISTIRGTMYVFLIAIIVFYSGSVIWKEREADMDQIYDAMPNRTWTVFMGKLLGLIGMVAVIQAVCILAGIVTQLLKGYTTLELDQYLIEFFAIDLIRFIPLIVLSMLVHTLVNQKYVAFFAFIVVLITNAYIWGPLDVSSNMVQFNASPDYTYSDMNGFGPFVKSFVWFRIYWTLVAALLGMKAILFWVRGRDSSWASRFRTAQLHFSGTNAAITAGLFGTLILCGGFIFYNTKVINSFESDDDQEERQVSYEQKYKKYQGIPQPRISNVKYTIDVYPEERNLSVKGDFVLVNRSSFPIDSVHIVYPNERKYTLSIDRAKLAMNDSVLQYQIYKLSPALAPGDSVHLRYTMLKETNGFENEVTFTKQINQNGSFFDNSDIAPMIGYQDGFEIGDKNKRKEHGLKEKDRMPQLARNCTDKCMNTYISNNSDWVMVETVISTSGDQMAVAPGSLLKEWTKTENGQTRKYYHYKLDHPSLNFYSFISARYEVAREKWNGIDVEVYYDKKHPYNVKNMLSSVKKSLAYYTQHFGPYYHKQARIIEFPRYASFAQAFPGTMPYSEGIGFIAKIDPEKDIDMVYYVVAHEMGHQWWAHQVVGADMQGATMLSETMAQYSALMVMEKEYGKDRMKKFLKYEMDRYLGDRGTESVKEVPLEKVENQGYIHYRKGSVVMYYLKEMIGEKAVNNALHELVQNYAYRRPPYPNAYALVDLFRKNTPDSLQYVITDLFEEMTVFNNRALSASYKKRPDGQFEVTVAVQSEKFRADQYGNEKPVTLNDWIDVGVYGRPADGKEQGKLLAIRREKMKKKDSTYTFVVKEEPYQAGIDPISFLVDRVPDDNLKKVEKL